MSKNRSTKRKWRKRRQQFKRELHPLLKDNKLLCGMVMQVRYLSSFRSVTYATWGLLCNNHPKAWEEYKAKIFDKVLLGTENLLIPFVFAGHQDFANKWCSNLPPTYMIGDAYAVAYSCLDTKVVITRKKMERI